MQTSTLEAYRNARKRDIFGTPAQAVHSLRYLVHRPKGYPLPVYTIGCWSAGRGHEWNESAPVEVESPVLVGLDVKVTVYQDSDGESLEDIAENADYRIETMPGARGYRFDPTDHPEDYPRPDRTAVAVDVGGSRDTCWWWVWLPEDYRTKDSDGRVTYRRHFDLPGASKSVALEYSDTKRRAAAQAMADHLQALADERVMRYGVVITASCDGEEVYSDSLWGIEASGLDEAARYFLDDGGISGLLSGCADWRREHAAHLAREASKLAARAADLLSGRDDS